LGCSAVRAASRKLNEGLGSGAVEMGAMDMRRDDPKLNI
jgi:hypothetical protein